MGSFARPEEVRFTDALPKTRSGKSAPSATRDRHDPYRYRGRHHA
ncbi:MAG: hypothetical protein WKF37_18535 [Bryobacteraceae bacterium]